MEVNVLGPLEVRENDRLITPSAGKQRQIVAMLALQAGVEATLPALVEELWGLRPPRTAIVTLHTYLRDLRRLVRSALEAGDPRTAKDVLITTREGYLLDGAATVDVRAYERLAARGRHALAAGDVEPAATLLRAALDQWRGPALVDVPVGIRLGMEVTRLDGSRLAVQDAYIEAELRRGNHQKVLGELSVLARRHPAHERLSGFLMLALHRCGQRWRAFEVFKRLRTSMIGEVGAEPSTAIQHLHQAILNADPKLDEPHYVP